MDTRSFDTLPAFFSSCAPRAGREITLENRINGWFLRSMNGKPLVKDAAGAFVYPPL